MKAGQSTEVVPAPARAEAILRSKGSRVTKARVAVLSLLLASGRSLTQHDVVSQLEGEAHMDNVTAYRVLDWLTGEGLAHRAVGSDRVWRFASSSPQAGRRARSGTPGIRGHAHAHFTCSQCEKTYCLDAVPAQLPAGLPRGYRANKVEMSVEGICCHCT